MMFDRYLFELLPHCILMESIRNWGPPSHALDFSTSFFGGQYYEGDSINKTLLFDAHGGGPIIRTPMDVEFRLQPGNIYEYTRRGLKRLRRAAAHRHRLLRVVSALYVRGIEWTPQYIEKSFVLTESSEDCRKNAPDRLHFYTDGRVRIKSNNTTRRNEEDIRAEVQISQATWFIIKKPSEPCDVHLSDQADISRLAALIHGYREGCYYTDSWTRG